VAENRLPLKFGDWISIVPDLQFENGQTRHLEDFLPWLRLRLQQPFFKQTIGFIFLYVGSTHLIVDFFKKNY